VTANLSVVLVAYDMARELPRTLTTLGTHFQRGCEEIDYEVIVVDNGSPDPVDPALMDLVPRGRLIRLDPAPGSPARAANIGIEAAAGDVIGVMIDGARMVSPGLVAGAASAASLGPRVMTTTMAFHLGSEAQMTASAKGYDQAEEDALLDTVDWPRDGYELFSIATFAGSSARGLFGPMGESNGLFMTAARWAELDGFDEIFDRPGGGLVNHDLFRRACESPGAELVVLIGEGTFHQFHGGAATGGKAVRAELWAEYARLRGRDFEPPVLSPRFLGSVAPQVMPHVRASVEWWERESRRHAT